MYKLTVSCILLTIFFVDVSQSKGHLEDCVYGNECDGNLNCFPDPRNSKSSATKCRCGFGQIYSPARSSCQSMESTACQNDTQCQDRDVNRNCNQTSNLCQCSGNKTLDQVTGKCLSKRLSQCRVHDDCPSNLECYQRTRTCLCPVNHVWNQSTFECRLMSQLNAVCTADSDCQDRDRNRICSNHSSQTKLCKCRPGYFYNSYTNYFCEKQRLFGESCHTGEDHECFGDHMACRRVEHAYRCRCLGDRIWSAKQSKCLSVSEFRCQNNDECQMNDQNRVCNATKHCDCKRGFYYNPDFRYQQCMEKVKLGRTCQLQVQCASNNSMCYKAHSWSSLGDCTCLPSHRRSNQVCLQRKCRDDYECGSPSFDEDKNFVCKNEKCGCRQGYAMDLERTGKCLRQSNVEGSTVRPTTPRMDIIFIN